MQGVMGGDAILVEMRGEQYALHPVWRVEVLVVEAFVPMMNHNLLATYHRVRLPIFELSSDKCIFLTT
ncbi:hypothetical protein HBI57_182180 [Parastagonospora nodorum]|nr:hypothetical protein HBI57_182180 [Parastagonospora nodorum]KAH6458499.1 hypothetical protein HBI58_193470 [Parastagonospora nodorum]